MTTRRNTKSSFERLLRRERGSRDWRMVPVAVIMWTACLVVHAWYEASFPKRAPASMDSASWAGSWGSAAVAVGILVAAVLAVVTGMAVASGRAVISEGAGLGVARSDSATTGSGVRHGGVRHGGLVRDLCRAGAVQMLVLCVAAGVAAVGMLASDATMSQDASVAAAYEGNTRSTVVVRIDTPITASTLRQADCQTDATVRMLTVSGTKLASSAEVRLFAADKVCGALSRGAVVQVHGTLSPARFGRHAVWLICEGGPVRQVAAPSAAQATVTTMHEAFFSVTDRLSDQGRVLVPGLTMGLLGQDHIGETQREPVDATYARILQDRFRRSGIMHLMAVSGGHFMLIGAVVRRLGCLIPLPRQIAAILQIVTYLLLASAMFPSDSVRRALMMGIVMALAWLKGRPAQALNALSWTVIIVVTVDPQMSRSFGFALSCSAVFGIVVCAKPISQWLGTHMPQAVAEALALAVCAQLFTLPIQLLMEPDLPVFSIPANILVAPFVDGATLTGLLGMVAAPLNTDVAYALVWVSSLMTKVMEVCALWLGGGSMATVPWAGGVVGAVGMVLAEVGAACAVMAISRGLIGRRGADGAMRWSGHHWMRIRRWFVDTFDMLAADR